MKVTIILNPEKDVERVLNTIYARVLLELGEIGEIDFFSVEIEGTKLRKSWKKPEKIVKK